MAEVLETGEDQFEADVLKSDTPVLVDFWAPWCGPCKMVAPVVEELAGDYDGKLKVVKVNVDDNPGLSVKYQVRGIPTLLIFNDGEVAQQVVGYVPKAALAEKVDAVLAG
ncbi:thioredoxin [Candidatus Poribacteria bacterium]|jgi:thioredoxin 1|nr:thioredoxin [Candidatus Poribacteria bacterium]MBT5534710.1 thioredoxin [Candidatus Poribacteria bacterium]MBT5715260.1 thioredoxin [Candidatus Poribacteria bacterium]MBT7097202.1 thioredoxin [Candidatus Poribacteria bacterium]MBT7809051.1 thioredoxin [Candidatus Poribacteria bacterium]